MGIENLGGSEDLENLVALPNVDVPRQRPAKT